MLEHNGSYANDGNPDILGHVRRALMLDDNLSQNLLGWYCVWCGQRVEFQQEGVFWLRRAARRG
jgi:hypothetical protein